MKIAYIWDLISSYISMTTHFIDTCIAYIPLPLIQKKLIGIFPCPQSFSFLFCLQNELQIHLFVIPDFLQSGLTRFSTLFSNLINKLVILWKVFSLVCIYPPSLPLPSYHEWICVTIICFFNFLLTTKGAASWSCLTRYSVVRSLGFKTSQSFFFFFSNSVI